jgi:probable HAF family extracellular repeat protein
MLYQHWSAAMKRLWELMLVVAVLLLFSFAAEVARAAKPGPPPPPPPVQYVLHWLGPGLAWAMNDAGTIVGEAGGHATLYTAANGMEDLNNIGAVWTELDGTPAPGWLAIKATGINFWGQVVGTAANGAGQARAFLMDDPFSLTPVFKLLPLDTLAVGGRQGINDHGDIASPSAVDGKLIVYVTPDQGATYTWTTLSYPTGIGIGLHINNAGTIVGCGTNYGNGMGQPGMLFSPGPSGYSLTIYSAFTFLGVSNGTGNITPKICGRFFGTKGGKQLPTGPMRMEATGASYQVLEQSGRWGFGINDQGDVCIGYVRPALYTDFNNIGLLDFDKSNVVVNPDAEWNNALLHLKAIGNRSSSPNPNFGVIAGNTFVPLAPLGEGDVFILIPRVPAP